MEDMAVTPNMVNMAKKSKRTADQGRFCLGLGSNEDL